MGGIFKDGVYSLRRDTEEGLFAGPRGLSGKKAMGFSLDVLKDLFTRHFIPVLKCLS